MTMRQPALLLLLLTTAYSFSFQVASKHQSNAAKPVLSMFYCGFGGDFCGQSTDDDVNAGTTNVILAFVNTSPDGSVFVDKDNYPTDLQAKWQAAGKKVLISVGGQNGNWAYIFATQDSTNNFVNSVKSIIATHGLDGVDIDIESYMVTPRTVANMINQLRGAIGTSKLLIVSPECVAVYQGVADYSADTAGQAYNYFVNVIKLADKSIDYYQPQAYNNWYDVSGGSLDYLKDVYLNWRNLPGVLSWEQPIANFTGVSGDKLLMGVLASTSAGGSSYYYSPDVIAQFRQWLADNNYPLKGFMMWDSHWDSLNGKAISNACTQ
jgi:chitinase